MKLIVFVALVAVANAQYAPGAEADATIVKNEFKQAGDNSFSNDVETSNGIKLQTVGESFPGSEPETGSSRQFGSYEYVSPEGLNVRVEWEADDEGFRAKSPVIPV